MTRSRRAVRPAPPARAAPRPSWIDAAFGLTTAPTAAEAAARLRALRRVVLVWSAVRTVVWTRLDVEVDPTLLGVSAVALAAAAALAFTPRHEHWASRVALPVLLVQLVATFPLMANHFVLELYALAILACGDGSERDDGLVLAGLRWLTALVLFLTGCQKLAFGHYWHGDFLAFMVGRGDRFADLFQWVLPASEVTRLQSYDPFRGGAGPYRAASTPFVLMSNAVWLAELALPVGLLARRTRLVAAMAAALFVVAIQLGARELGFALLFTNLLVTFAPLAIARLVSTGSLVALALVAAAALGLVPGAALVRSWHLW